MNKIINEVKKGRGRHWRNFIDRDYLGSHNLEKDEDMVVTIQRVEPEENVENHKTNKTETKMALYFKENVPKMIINITNATTIEQLYGTHIEDWEGKRIQLMTAKVQAFGKTQDALRIRDIAPRAEITLEDAKVMLNNCRLLDDLKFNWSKLPAKMRDDKNLIEIKDNLKIKLK